MIYLINVRIGLGQWVGLGTDAYIRRFHCRGEACLARCRALC